MKKIDEISAKVIPAVSKFASAKPIMALKDGFVLTMPITLIGSIFMLIKSFPISNWKNIMAGIFGEQWAAPLNQVTGATFDIIALVAVFGIAYSYAKASEVSAVPAGILSIVSFLVVSNAFVTTEAGEVVTGVIPKVWTGGQGMITSIIIGLCVGAIYSWFIRRDIRIKMPDSVPEGVANAFSALIPGFVIVLLSMILYSICNATKGISMTEIIYNILQVPMQNLSDSLVGSILIMAFMSIFWWFGLHGANIILGIISPVLTANSLANQAVVDAGGTLVVGENAKIVTSQFVSIYAKFGGVGLTLGLIIAVLIAARSQQLRQLSKMSLLPGIFNINEPVIFGLPIVFNPIMAIPFIIVPVIAVLMIYFSLVTGFIQPFTALQLPWTTPPVISGFILSGWQGAVLQILITAMSTVIYLPFVKMQDKVAYEQELAYEEENNVA